MKFKLNEKYGYRFRDRFIIQCIPEKGDLQTIPPTVLLENMFACIIDTGTCYYVIKNISNKPIKELAILKGAELNMPINRFIDEIVEIKYIVNNVETGTSDMTLWDRVSKLFSIFENYYDNVVYISCKDEEYLDRYFPEINRFHDKISPYISKLSKINIDEIRNHFELGNSITQNDQEIIEMSYILFKEIMKDMVDKL